MAATIPKDLLRRRPEEGARLIARHHLSQVRARARALLSGHDPEALHDLRVSIRRLRGALRAFRPFLPGRVGDRCRRKLGRVMDATNRARDLEVALAGLDRLPAQPDAAAHLAARWHERHARAEARARRAVDRDLDDAVRGLRRRLRSFEAEVVGHPAPVFLDAAREAANAEGRALAAAITRLRTEGGDDALHDVRLSAKRLRYLLEPLAPLHRKVAPTIARLTTLQDVLGGMRDRALLAARLRREATRAPEALRADLLRLAADAEGRGPADLGADSTRGWTALV